jgi:Sec-independent protein translocase protein TatA
MWHQYVPIGRFGLSEFLILLLVAFILFGHWLPSIMRDIGRSLFRGPWD